MFLIWGNDFCKAWLGKVRTTKADEEEEVKTIPNTRNMKGIFLSLVTKSAKARLKTSV